MAVDKRYWFLLGAFVIVVFGAVVSAVSLSNSDGYILVNGSSALEVYTINFNRSNSLNLTADGQPLVLTGNATVWNDFAITSTALASGAFAPSLTQFNNTVFYCYAGSVRNEFSYGSTELFHDWKEGSSLYPHIHTITAAPANYTFRLDYTLYNSQKTVSGFREMNITHEGYGVVVDTLGAPIDASGFGIGSVFGFTITRLQDASFDTYTGCVGVAQVSVHYESDTLGSAGVFTKW